MTPVCRVDATPLIKFELSLTECTSRHLRSWFFWIKISATLLAWIEIGISFNYFKFSIIGWKVPFFPAILFSVEGLLTGKNFKKLIFVWTFGKNLIKKLKKNINNSRVPRIGESFLLKTFTYTRTFTFTQDVWEDMLWLVNKKQDL